MLAQLGITGADAEAYTRVFGESDIVLMPTFIQTLFPGASESDVPREFELLHYNGIARPGGVVKFVAGAARSEAPRDFAGSDDNAKALMQVLRTKWDPLECNWTAPVSIT